MNPKIDEARKSYSDKKKTLPKPREHFKLLAILLSLRYAS